MQTPETEVYLKMQSIRFSPKAYRYLGFPGRIECLGIQAIDTGYYFCESGR